MFWIHAFLRGLNRALFFDHGAKLRWYPSSNYLPIGRHIAGFPEQDFRSVDVSLPPLPLFVSDSVLRRPGRGARAALALLVLHLCGRAQRQSARANEERLFWLRLFLFPPHDYYYLLRYRLQYDTHKIIERRRLVQKALGE